MSPVLPHAPGSLYGSVFCILLLEKDVKYKRHYYCSVKVSENAVMYHGTVLGTWKWVTLCLCPWGAQPCHRETSVKRHCWEVSVIFMIIRFCAATEIWQATLLLLVLFCFLSWVVECRGKWSTMRKPRGLDFYLISTLTRYTNLDKTFDLSVS